MHRDQAGQSLHLECLRPAGHKTIVAGQLGTDVHAAFPVGPQEHAARSPCQCGASVALANHRLQILALLVSQFHPVHAFDMKHTQLISMIQWTRTLAKLVLALEADDEFSLSSLYALAGR